MWTLGYDHRVARPDYRNTYWRSRALGGGVILDLSSHASNLVQWFLGPVRSVMAAYDRLQMEGTPCEDTLSYILRFQNGPALATLHCSAWLPQRIDLLTISGTQGTLSYDGVSGRLGVASRDGAWSWTEGLNGKPDAKGQIDEPFIAQAGNFIDAMEGRAEPFCSLEDGRHTLEICDAVHASGAQRREIELSPAPVPTHV
jgi:predicted dehydrogenase